MIQKHRISTNIGKDQILKVELKQDFDLLEILSLKFTQKDVYTSLCSDYGVVCGRITVNNGLGVPNARISIFIPLDETDEQDPVISTLYPFKTVSDINENNYRYNLLPHRKQHGGHEPTGTFFDQSDILTREEVLEVYEKYYKYTVKTNTAGDFMIWGVPLGEQTIHVDVDLSDIGCFSLRPDDFIRQGVGVDAFKNSYSFKSSEDFNSLPQIVTFDQTIDVYPFWGNEDLCEIGITRTDFDLSDRGVKIEPKSYLLGSIFTDEGDNSVNKNCTPKNSMGNKCGLISDQAKVEILRFTSQKDSNGRPTLEIYDIQEDIDDSGSFVLSLPMNMEFLTTNEFGENELTNDPNKGVATSACYRFRVSIKNESLGRVRTTASYLIPNIREYNTNDSEVEKSYAWSTKWSDYPTAAINNTVIFNNQFGSYYPQDYFYRFTYNKVYGVSSFMGSFFSSSGLGRNTYLGIKEIAPKSEDDCQNSVVTPPINFGMQKFTFAILLAIIVSTFERIIYYAFIAAVQVLILPFQKLYEFRIYIRAFRVTLINWRPFGFFDNLVIEPLQRFGTVRLGIAIYPECETCDNLDYTNVSPVTNVDPEGYYTEVGSGTGYPDSILEGACAITDDDTSLATIYLKIPSGIEDCTLPSFSPTLTGINIDDIVSDSGRYLIKITSTGNNGQMDVYTKEFTDISGTTHTLYYFDDTRQITWVGGSQQTTTFSYKIFDTESLVSGAPTPGGLNSELQGGCQQYVTVHKETIVSGTYCVDNASTPYSSLSSSNITSGSSCVSSKIAVGQVIKSSNTNPCGTCGTHSGFSEFRYGLFTIVPAASTSNWGVNFDAITEYARRKLVAKLFCEGISNYSFMDNWLTGSLYMFPFKAKVRWDDENELDLNYRRTKYCSNLVYFKIGSKENVDKRFYYRSTVFNGTTFTTGIRSTLGHPTTVVDLGPRDEFIKEICLDPSLDPNCSVVRNIGPTSYQDFKELLGLYINYKLDDLGPSGNYTSFFDNNGFNSILPSKMDGYILNGDVLQLISINNEVGIEQFDLQNRNYAVYSPQVLDVESYSTLLDGGPLPINFVLDDGEGYRVRSCINEPGRLTESSQNVPFYLWDKGGSGFGSGTDHHWDYSQIEVQPLQGMTKNYKYSGDTTHPYLLLPMTKNYAGNTFTFTGVTYNDLNANVESITDVRTAYSTRQEGFTFLHVTSWSSGTTDDQKITNATAGTFYTRVGDAAVNSSSNWTSQAWTNDTDFIITPTTTNYNTNKQILSTPFLFYFGLRPGKTSVDKFIERFGPKGAFTSAE